MSRASSSVHGRREGEVGNIRGAGVKPRRVEYMEGGMKWIWDECARPG